MPTSRLRGCVRGKARTVLKSRYSQGWETIMIEINAKNVTPASRRSHFRVVGFALIWTILLTGCQQPSDDKVIEQLPEPFLIRYQISTQPAALPVEPIAQKIELPANRFAKWLPPGGLSKRWNCVVIHHTASDIGSLSDI